MKKEFVYYWLLLSDSFLGGVPSQNRFYKKRKIWIVIVQMPELQVKCKILLSGSLPFRFSYIFGYICILSTLLYFHFYFEIKLVCSLLNLALSFYFSDLFFSGKHFIKLKIFEIRTGLLSLRRKPCRTGSRGFCGTISFILATFWLYSFLILY